MTRRIALLFLLTLLAQAALAQTALFVNSVPIRAEVTINGTSRGSTPLLVRDLPPGEYEVTATKPGHVPATTRIELVAGVPEAVELTLEPDTFVLSFSASETIVDDRVFARRESRLRLPSGTYQLSPDGTGLRLQPVYPNEGALAAARLVTIAVGTVSLLATVEDVIVGDAQSWFTGYLPSPGTLAGWTVTAAAGGFWIGLAAERRAYEERMVVRPYEGFATPAEAERSYESAERALEAGNLSLALSGYTRVFTDGGDSEFVPDSIYKAGQIYAVSGDLELAAELLEILVADYPAATLYDRGLRALADAYAGMGRYDDAIEALRSMVYYESIYEPDDIESDIEDIRRRAEEGSE